MNNENIVILDVDNRPALEKTAAANKQLDATASHAKTASKEAGQAFNQAADTVVSFTSRSKQSIDRLVSGIERKALFSGKTGVDRLIVERDLALQKLKGYPAEIDKVTRAYQRMIDAEKDAAKSSQDIAQQISDPLGTAKQGFTDMLGSMGKWGAVALGTAAAAGMLGKAWLSMADAQMAAAEGMVNLSDRTGLSINTIDKLQAMSRIANVNVESLESASRTLAQSLEDTSENGSKARQALDRMGVSVYDLSGNQRNLGQVTLDVIQKLSKIENAAERNALATRALGRGAVELLPLIKNYGELEKTVTAMGFGTREGLIRALAEADDKMDQIGLQWDLLKGKMSTPISAVIEVTVKGLDAASRFSPGSYKQGPREGELFGADIKPPKVTTPGSNVDYAGIREALRRERVKAFESQLRADPKERLKAIDEKLGEERRKAQQGLEGAAQVYGELEREKAALEKMIQKAEEVRKLREKRLELIGQQRRVAGKDRSEGSSLYVSPAKIDTAPDLAGLERKRFEESLRTDQQIADMRAETARRSLDYEVTARDQQRQKELAGVEMLTARTLQEKIAVEQKKLDIERRFIEDSFALKAEALDREQQLELAKAGDNAALRSAIIERYGQLGAELMTSTSAQLEREQTESQLRVAKTIEDQYRSTWETVRQSYERTLDSLFSTTRSWGDRIKSIFEAAILTPFKQASSAWFANLVTPRVMGQGGGMAPAPSGLGSIFGSVGGFGLPTFGGGYGTVGGVNGPYGMPGATPPFMPTGGGGFGIPGFGGLGFLRGLGNIGMKQPGQLEMLNPFFSQSGVGGLAGGAMLLGGGSLAAAGLYRGGWSGLGMATAGGALIGAKFGGPIGAAIGAGVGLAAGFIRMLFKGRDQKVIDEVKSIYGVSIDKTFAKVLSEQSRGQDMRTFLRSPAIREQVQLYAEMTGQRGGVTDAAARGVFLSQSGGIVSQAGSYSGSGLYGYQSSLPGASGMQVYTRPAASAQPVINLTIQADGAATTALMQGATVEFVNGSPRVIARANMEAQQQSFGLTQQRVNILNPLAI